MAADLDIPQLAEAQSRPDITSNDATEALAEALSSKFDCDLTSGNISVTAGQYRRAIIFRAINCSTTRTVTLPQVEREFVIVECDSANTHTVDLIRGSTTITMAIGRTYLVRTDGTANGLVARDIGGTSEPNVAALFVPGLMTNAQLCLVYNVSLAFSLPTNLVGSHLTSTANATADTTFTFKKNGSSIGTATIATGTKVATFTVTATSFALSDIFSIEGPATADATVINVAGTFLGTR